jgi:hypothetical protein
MRIKMQKATNQMIVACLLLGLLYFFVQIIFINFYAAYKLPFGRGDVDNYFDILSPTSTKNIMVHPGLYLGILFLSKITNVALVFTFLIPFIACVVLNLVFFIFMLYFTKDPNISLLGMVFFIIGTYSMEAFIISAFWAQLFATILVLLFIIFFEHYKSSNNKTALLLAFACFVIMLPIHIKVAGCVFLYIMIRMFFDKEYGKSAILFAIVLLGIAVYPDVLTPDYVVNVSLTQVLSDFMLPIFWAIMVFYCFKKWSTFNNAEKTWVVFFVVVFLLSSRAALWRPLLSVLPIGIYFVSKFFKWLYSDKAVFISALVLILILSAVYTRYQTSLALTSMIGEMVPGVFNDTNRNMDPGPMLKMFSGSDADLNKFNSYNRTHRVTGFISYFTGNVTEKDEVVYGP